MKTQHAIDKAGSPSSLAKILGITVSAVSQWGPDVPKGRMWQLKVLRPEWFEPERSPTQQSKSATA